MVVDADNEAPPVRPVRRRRGMWTLLAVVGLLLAALAVAWLSRERIASEVVRDALAEQGIEARYEIVSIGTRRAVLRNIVIGDPARPDLSVERATVRIGYGFGLPGIDALHLVRPRLHGRYIDGRFSLGALDPLLFGEEEDPAPFELPDLHLTVEDGRALLDSDFGRVGLSLSGEGWLRDGFAGELAASAPELAAGGCAAGGATLYGRIAIANARPEFAGPLRWDRLSCDGGALVLARSSVGLDLESDQRLDGIEGEVALALGAGRAPQGRLAGLSGPVRFTWRGGDLTARYALEGRGIATPQAALARLTLDGALRTRRDFERVELDAQASGAGLVMDGALDAALGDAARATGGTLLEPILRQVRATLAAQAPGSTFSADLIARRTGQRLSLVVPEARLRGGSGAVLLALSRAQLAGGGTGPAVLSGNLVTGGPLPRIAARVDRGAGGIRVRASMAPYRAGGAVLAVPELILAQDRGGALRFAGDLRASGPLPGGAVEALVLPLSGRWSPAGGLALWGGCTQLRFDRLRYANLSLDGRRLTLCPPPGRAIVRAAPGAALSIAAGAPSLRLNGRLGETPIALASGPVGFALPGTLTARRVNVALGPAATATRFAIADLTARIGREIGGRFAGADVLLFAVPLDLRDAGGTWRYADGRLTLTDGAFRLVDREQDLPRFEPLVARDATLALADNRISAQALLREPVSDRAVSRVDLRHDLATGIGSADLTVPGLLFDAALQPVALTPRALGVVANVAGTVSGSGRIDWSPQALTSTGAFSTAGLDFAAAFGPVRGAVGTVRFTDLIGLTTAPGQRLRVAAINPGLEVTDGTIGFQLRDGEVLAVEGGSWPFYGGTLTMRPLAIRFGAPEERAFVFVIEGLDMALFVARTGIANLSAAGILDGTLPVVFDREGNGSVEGGLLVSRPPGGNISYVGELTYEDLSPTANFAFDALRSLDYRQLMVQADGSLTGEIVTRVRFDGVSQGIGARRNIITRALAGLPIRFEVNIRAPFYTLFNSIRGIYDPAAIRDPRELGLLDAAGNPIRRQTDGVPAPDAPPDPPDADDLVRALVQPSDREEVP